MPCRIRIPQRIVEHIRIAVEALRVRWVGDDGVRLQESPLSRIIVSRVVKVQPNRRILDLTGVAACRGRQRVIRPARAAPGIIPLFGIFGSSAGRGERR